MDEISTSRAPHAAALHAAPDGAHEATEVLEGKDGDIELRLRAELSGERLVLDSAAAPSNRRATSTARSR